MFGFRLNELNVLTFFTFVLCDVTCSDFAKSAKSSVQTFKIARIHVFNALFPIKSLNGNVILRTQFLLVLENMIFMQAQDGLYNYKVTINEALK